MGHMGKFITSLRHSDQKFTPHHNHNNLKTSIEGQCTKLLVSNLQECHSHERKMDKVHEIKQNREIMLFNVMCGPGLSSELGKGH